MQQNIRPTSFILPPPNPYCQLCRGLGQESLFDEPHSCACINIFHGWISNCGPDSSCCYYYNHKGEMVVVNHVDREFVERPGFTYVGRLCHFCCQYNGFESSIIERKNFHEHNQPITYEKYFNYKTIPFLAKHYS